MKGNIIDKTVKKSINEKLIILTRTHKIVDDDKGIPEWDWMDKQYKDPNVEDSIEQAMVSIVNSLITQRRIVFCLTRDMTRELVHSDKNWPKAIGFKNEKWKTLLHFLYQHNLIEKVQPTKGRRPAIYKVISKNILEHIVVDYNQQLAETISFVESIDSGDGKGDGKGDGVVRDKGLVGRDKEEVSRNKKEELDLAKQRIVQNSCISPWKDKSSSWYTTYLKSHQYEEIYLSLPEKIRASLYAQTCKLAETCTGTAKDNFLGTLIDYKYGIYVIQEDAIGSYLVEATPSTSTVKTQSVSKKPIKEKENSFQNTSGYGDMTPETEFDYILNNHKEI